MEYRPFVGLEIHIELKTRSKMFCSCSADWFGVQPNSHTCPVCLGLPGALPVPNKKAIEYCLLTGMALNCRIPSFACFERKNYFYPDLPKGYQISQYSYPFAVEGYFEFEVPDLGLKRVGIDRVHLEEDTGKLIHVIRGKEKFVLIDFNRAGVPLMEIVTKPDLSSPEEVKFFAKNLRQLIRYLGVSDADMEKGQMRFEANVSLQRQKKAELPDYRVEIKNLNSIKFLEKAVRFEIERQKGLLEKGEKLAQETRGWDEKKQETYLQRGKEEACDYRYFPEPDIPPFFWEQETLKKIGAMIPELPREKQKRFQKWFGLNEYETNLLTEDKCLADWFEEALKSYVQTVWPGIDLERGKPKEPVAISAFAKVLANWTIGKLLKKLREERRDFSRISLPPARMAEFLYLLDQKKISSSQGKEVFAEMWRTGKRPSLIIKKRKLRPFRDKKRLEKLVARVIEENQKAVADIKQGKKEAIDFLIGQVMKRAKRGPDPKMLRDLLIQKLGIGR